MYLSLFFNNKLLDKFKESVDLALVTFNNLNGLLLLLLSLLLLSYLKELLLFYLLIIFYYIFLI